MLLSTATAGWQGGKAVGWRPETVAPKYVELVDKLLRLPGESDAAVGGALRESLLGAQRLPAGVARMLLVGSPPGESVVPISMIDPPRRVQ